MTLIYRSEHYDVCISEKIGTHINAASTYKRGHKNDTVSSVDLIPLEYLVNIPGKLYVKLLQAKIWVLAKSQRFADVQKILIDGIYRQVIP